LKLGPVRTDSVTDSTSLTDPEPSASAGVLPPPEPPATSGLGVGQARPQSKPAPSSSAPAPAPAVDAGWVKPAWAIPDEEVPVHRGPTETQ
ncbi:MAG TPA: hypothetical protein VGP93_20215, partial [Polyangiaceae bacterium]|nr:hypothetical protein [Polyangiaceae bacterium]